MLNTTRTIDLSTKAGQTWKFKPENGTWTDIRVPEGGWRAQGHTCDAGTYRTEITIPKDLGDNLVQVAFEAVNFGAELLIGRDESTLKPCGSHICGWMPFSADLSPFVKPGDKILLEVRVRGRKKFMRNDKYTVPQGGTWLESLADGIIRGIRLEVLPRVYIADVFITTRVSDSTINIQPVVVNVTDKPAEITLSASFKPWSNGKFQYPEIAKYSYTLEPGERLRLNMAQASWLAGPESYWWPNVPFNPGFRSVLHRVDLDLAVGGKPVHTLERRFGFREFNFKGPNYYLNGIRCNLRGDNQQEANFGTDAYGIFPGFGPPTPSNPGWPKAVENLLGLNFNVLRIHQIPAVPYMLDVTDEMGLMIVAETPVRGSEGKEDFVVGRENMIAAARELALRDHRHPSVVIWSAANEIWNERGLALALMTAMLAVDDTRPVIIDGVEDLGWPILNMEHYTTGFGPIPDQGGKPREDRPFGETESVWPMDNSLQGFVWMGTATRARRLRGNADIRNYVLNNAWPNYVPGQAPELQFLEKKIKNILWKRVTSGMDILPAIQDPWNHPQLSLFRNCCNPVTACDVHYDQENKESNAAGDWPSSIPDLPCESVQTRSVAVFNDEFSGETVKLDWEVREGRPAGPRGDSGSLTLRIPLGEHMTRKISFKVPDRPGEFRLLLRTSKDGETRFAEDRTTYRAVEIR